MEQINGDCPSIGDGTDARVIPYFLGPYMCEMVLHHWCRTPAMCVSTFMLKQTIFGQLDQIGNM